VASSFVAVASSSVTVSSSSVAVASSAVVECIPRTTAAAAVVGHFYVGLALAAADTHHSVADIHFHFAGIQFADTHFVGIYFAAFVILAVQLLHLHKHFHQRWA